MTGNSNWSNITKGINSTVGANISWKIEANDTSNNWNKSTFSYITTSGIDEISPKYSLNSTNSTLAGTNVLHSLKWTDETGLSNYIFSFDNCTGTFVNDSLATFSGTTNWSNVTKGINTTVGCTIQWKVYANDTSNNWNESMTYSYITTSAGGDTCTCPGAGNNWEVDMEDMCTLSTECNLGTGNLSWIGASGYFICDAQLNLTRRNAPPSNTIFYYYDQCEVNRL
jgi:hypothetical protein